MRINTMLVGAMSMRAVPMHSCPSTRTTVYVASSVVTDAGVTGVQGTTVSTRSASAHTGALVVEAVEAVRVKAAAVFTLKPLGSEAGVRGYGQAQDQLQQLKQDGTSSDTSTSSDNGINGTSPFNPWDFRTSSPPG